MRFKQDAVPGLAIHMHFTPIQNRDYEIACAELCGSVITKCTNVESGQSGRVR